MADNVSITSGVGTVIGCDDVGGVQYQRVKPVWGVDGTVTDTSATNPMPVADAGPNFGTLTRTHTAAGAIGTAVAITAAPSSGKKIYATDILVSVDTACYVTIQMETSNNVLVGMYMPASSTALLTLRGLIVGDANDKKLMLKSSVAANGAATVVYYSGT